MAAASEATAAGALAAPDVPVVNPEIVEKVARMMCALAGEDPDRTIQCRWSEQKIGGERPAAPGGYAAFVRVPAWRKRRPAAAGALMAHFSVGAVVSGRDVERAIGRARAAGGQQ